MGFSCCKPIILRSIYNPSTSFQDTWGREVSQTEQNNHIVFQLERTFKSLKLQLFLSPVIKKKMYGFMGERGRREKREGRNVVFVLYSLKRKQTYSAISHMRTSNPKNSHLLPPYYPCLFALLPTNLSYAFSSNLSVLRPIRINQGHLCDCVILCSEQSVAALWAQQMVHN